MAPMKNPRNSSTRNQDKNKRRRRPTDASMLYKCVGDLCGEDCEQELVPANKARTRRDEQNRRNSEAPTSQDVEMEAMTAASDVSDADWTADQDRTRRVSDKSGRVGKLKAKKVPSKQVRELPLKIGVQKAKRYLYEALDFGLQSGYLTAKDMRGQTLRVSSDLLLEKHLKRVDQERLTKKARDSQEMRDEEAGNVEDKRRGGRRSGRSARHGRSRSRSKRGGKKRGGRSRSRSRSKRRHGRKRMGRSRSVNPDADARAKQAKAEGVEEQDDMGTEANTTAGDSQNTNASNETDEHEDGKSVKSAKSAKSGPDNSDSQENTNEDGKHDDDASNDDDATDDDDNKK